MKLFQRTPPRPDARRRGVSLPVVMLALCLVAIGAVVAIPIYFSAPDVTLGNACKLLSRDLHAVQNRAAMHKVGARLVFDADGWRALDMAGKPIEGLGESHPIVRRFSIDGVFEGVRVEHIALGPDSAIGIDTRGMLIEDGTVELSFRGATRRVEIEAGVGQVRWSDADGEAGSEARTR